MRGYHSCGDFGVRPKSYRPFPSSAFPQTISSKLVPGGENPPGAFLSHRECAPIERRGAFPRRLWRTTRVLQILPPASPKVAALNDNNCTVLRKICSASGSLGTSTARNYENGSATEEPRIARHGGQATDVTDGTIRASSFRRSFGVRPSAFGIFQTISQGDCDRGRSKHQPNTSWVATGMASPQTKIRS